MNLLKEQVKNNIKELIKQGKYDNAQSLLEEYTAIAKKDQEIFSIKTVIYLHKEMLPEAQKVIQQGLEIYPNNFDLLYNLGFIFEKKQDFSQAYEYYVKAKSFCTDLDLIKQIDANLQKLNRRIIKKTKLVFFIKHNINSFVDEVVLTLSNDYETQFIKVTDLKQIDEGMKWADVCWFEWCDELIIYGSKLDIAKEKVIICRLHSYEAFTNYTKQVSWENVNKVIFVAEHIRKFVLEDNDSIKYEQTIVIPNGVDLEKYTFKDRKPGFNVAYVGYINYKKGPMLLLHTFKAIHERDSRYKLYLAGTFQDYRDILYFKQMIQKMGLTNHVIHEGWQNDINSWLDDKDYILCTSVLESQGMAIMQAMSKGIKPLIHNFVGAEQIYTERHVWTTISECVSSIKSKSYNSKEYRKYIEDNYSFEEQIQKINKMLVDIVDEKKNNSKISEPLVTVGILSYNYVHYLDQCIESVLCQSYKNIEIIISDDCSNDGSIEKLREYEERYNNIRVIYHDKNSGYAIQGLQDIVREAKGKYFTYLSSDDFLTYNTSLEELVQTGENYPDIDYIYSDLRLVDKDSTVIGMWEYQQYTSNEIIAQTFRRFGSGVIPLTVGGLFKTNFYRDHNREWSDDRAGNNAGDTLHTIINLTYGWKVRYMKKDSVSYRQHTNNLSFNLRKRIPSIINLIEYIIKNFDEKIYLFEINWERYSNVQRESLKFFVLGKYYCEMLEHYEKRENSKYTTKELIELFQLIVDKISYYFNKSIVTSQEYASEINSIKKILKKKGYSICVNALKIEKKYTRQELILEGLKLRNSLLDEYKDKYLHKKLKILMLSPSHGAWKYTFHNWMNILSHMGVQVTLIDKVDGSTNYDGNEIFITIANTDFIQKYSINPSIQKISKKIGIATKENFFDSTNSYNDLLALEFISQDSTFQFLIASFTEPHIKNTFSLWLEKGVVIHSIPFGFNPLIHYPENIKQDIDYFFVGHNSYVKVEETRKYIEPIFSNYRGGILGGTGWGREVQEILPQDVRYYYNRAKINLNYHIEIQKKYECEVNERTYIICACGGFQLIDNPKYLQRIYTRKDMAIAEDEKQYLELFEHYLHNSKERLEIAFNGLYTTYENKSSLLHRMDKLLGFL